MGCFSLARRRLTIESRTANGRGWRVCLEPPRFSGRKEGAVARLDEEKRGVDGATDVDDDGGQRSCGAPGRRVVSGAMAAPTTARRATRLSCGRARRTLRDGDGDACE